MLLREVIIDAENYQLYIVGKTASHEEVQSGKDGKKKPTLIIFKDVNGETFVVTHGRNTAHVLESKGKTGLLSRIKIWLCPATLQAWKDTASLRKSLPPEIGKYSLICCYGGMIRNNDPRCNVVNTTNDPCYTVDQKLMWGMYSLSIYSASETESEEEE